MRSFYLSDSPLRTISRSRTPLRAIFALAMALIAGLLSMSPLLAAEEASAGPVDYVACELFGEDSLPRHIYQFSQTSDLQFHLLSKSYSGAGASDVSDGFNRVLDYIKTRGIAEKESSVSFQAINEAIIGQNLDGTIPEHLRDKKSVERWNKGVAVNPYDRFGVAGLHFSNYLGEWNHLFIDACAEEREEPSGEAQFETGLTTNTVRVAAWNICSRYQICNLSKTYQASAVKECKSSILLLGETICKSLTNDETLLKNIYGDTFEERAKMAVKGHGDREGELSAFPPDVLLLQEAYPENRSIINEHMCEAAGLTMVNPPKKNEHIICYNGNKFREISNSEFPGAQGSISFDKVGSGLSRKIIEPPEYDENGNITETYIDENGQESVKRPGEGAHGFTWAILEDESLRRSVFVSIHLQAEIENHEIRMRQMKYFLTWIHNEFAGSSYPVVVGGDFNSQWSKGFPKNRSAASEAFRADGNGKTWRNTFEYTSSGRDLSKSTFQGQPPWSSANHKKASHIDHIWVNQYVGIGEAGVYAYPGMATSDHAMVYSTLNLNGLHAAQPGDPTDPGVSKFYNSRVTPMSTWDKIGVSEDIRTQHFSQGLPSRYIKSFFNNASNFIFAWTKAIVVITIALIGIAFSDPAEFMGFNATLSGDGTNGGLFNNLHESLFQPLILLAILATAVYMLWTGLIKRQIREALVSFLRSTACFVAAVAIAINPAWFIAFPNNVAVVAQSFIASAVNVGSVGGHGVCKSDISEFAEPAAGSTSLEEARGLLERSALNAQSAIGCTLWYNLLLRPWVEGQFGSDYNKLYGTKDTACSTAPTTQEDAACMGANKTDGVNRNWEWAGGPIVPMGGGTTTSNWALLHLSTQTNAHSPIVAAHERGYVSKYSQGVAHDWWRVVDGVSNFQVEFKKEKVAAASNKQTDMVMTVLENDTMDEWDTWSGNHQIQRIMTVIGSLVAAGLSVIVPLIFAFMTVIYAVGIAILMAFAPVFFLLGCWAGRGWEIFKAWWDLLINTTMKRIIMGVLLIVSLTLTTTALALINDPLFGYWRSLILLIVLSVALWKIRHKILAAASFSNMSSIGLGQTAGRITDKFKNFASGAGDLATATAVGGITSARRGQGFGAGAWAGAKNQVKNMSYRSPGIMSARDTYDAVRGGHTSQGLEKERCARCGEAFEVGQVFGRLETLEIVHELCIFGTEEWNGFITLGTVEAGGR